MKRLILILLVFTTLSFVSVLPCLADNSAGIINPAKKYTNILLFMI